MNLGDFKIDIAGPESDVGFTTPTKVRFVPDDQSCIFTRFTMSTTVSGFQKSEVVSV